MAAHLFTRPIFGWVPGKLLPGIGQVCFYVRPDVDVMSVDRIRNVEIASRVLNVLIDIREIIPHLFPFEMIISA